MRDSIEGPFLAFYRSSLLDGLVVGADYPRDTLDQDDHWNGFRFYNVQPKITKSVAPPSATELPVAAEPAHTSSSCTLAAVARAR
jgi:hypothetical protein